MQRISYKPVDFDCRYEIWSHASFGHKDQWLCGLKIVRITSEIPYKFCSTTSCSTKYDSKTYILYLAFPVAVCGLVSIALTHFTKFLKLVLVSWRLSGTDKPVWSRMVRGKGGVNGEVCHRFETHHPLSSVFKLTSSLPVTLSKGASKLLHLVESFTRLFPYSRYNSLYVTFDQIFATEYDFWTHEFHVS